MIPKEKIMICFEMKILDEILLDDEGFDDE